MRISWGRDANEGECSHSEEGPTSRALEIVWSPGRRAWRILTTPPVRPLRSHRHGYGYGYGKSNGMRMRLVGGGKARALTSEEGNVESCSSGSVAPLAVCRACGTGSRGGQRQRRSLSSFPRASLRGHRHDYGPPLSRVAWRYDAVYNTTSVGRRGSGGRVRAHASCVSFCPVKSLRPSTLRGRLEPTTRGHAQTA